MQSRAKTLWRLLAWLLALAWAPLLCALPLVGVPGYEAAWGLTWATALVGVGGAHTAVVRWRAGPPSEGAWSDVHPLRTVLRLWLRGTARGALFVAWGALVLYAHARWVRACQPARGLLWLAVLPGTAAACGAALGVVARLLLARAGRAWLLAAAVMLASLALSLLGLYRTPAVFAHDAFFGYAAGAIYDEAVRIDATLLAARGYFLLVAAAALAWAALLLDGERRRLGPRLERRWRLLLLALALSAGAVAAQRHSGQLGFAISTAEVRRSFGGELETPHFVLHYTPGGAWARELALHAEDHELRWAQLRALLGAAPDGKIHSYLFESPEHKRRWTGAANVYIAKPWRHEIYLHADGFPHSALMHELAHVFLRRFGDRWLGVARRGLSYSGGLVEGAAEAASWRRNPLDPHERARLLLDGGRLPPVRRLLGGGFFGFSSQAAYSAAGSFCRFLAEQHGWAALERVYGGDDWQAAFGESLESLEARWRNFLTFEVVVPPAEAAVVADWLRAPGILRKRCPHELALLRRRADAAAGTTQALVVYDEMCREDPDDPGHLIALANAALAVEARPRAEAALARAEHHPKLTASGRAVIATMRADAAARAGDVPTAAAEYARALALPRDAGERRLLALKAYWAAHADEPFARALAGFLFGGLAGDRLLALAAELARRFADEPLADYLYAKQLENHGAWVEAVRALLAVSEHVVARPLPTPDFEAEALRMLGRAAFRGRIWPLSLWSWIALAERNPRAAAEADDWIARLRFAL